MTEFVCRRCLESPNLTGKPDEREELRECSKCGTENWCLPVSKKVSEAQPLTATEEVAESIPEDKFEPSKESMQSEIDALRKQEKENLGIEAESVTEATSEEYSPTEVPDLILPEEEAEAKIAELDK